MSKTFSFAAERYDRLANEYFDYTIMVYKSAKGVESEVIESKSKRRFAARKLSSLTIGQCFIGATIVINTFQFTITAYNDEATSAALSQIHESTFAVVHGQSFESLGKIITAATGFGFTIAKLQTMTVNAGLQSVLRHVGLRIQNGPAAFMVLLRPDAVEEWQKLSQRFGSPEDVHASESAEAAQAETEQIFKSDVSQKTSARASKQSTLCLIKPHAVAAGHAGAIIQQLEDNLNVTAVEQVHVTKEDALEFLRCYRGVLPEFSLQVEGLYDGPSIAVEITGEEGQDAVGALRQLAGPYDVMCAKCLAPESLRAQFGVNNVDNAVHVTDLSTDGQIETNFFFKVLKT